MAYFVYESPIQTSPFEMQPETDCTIVAASPEETQAVRQRLMSHALDEDFTGEVSTDDIDVLIESDANKIPSGILSKLLSEEADCHVIDKATNLEMYSTYSDNDYLSFRILSIEVNKLVAPGVTRDPLFEQLVLEHGFNRYVYQVQPNPDGTFETHHGLGYSDEQRRHMPILTILNASHPVRKAVESKQ